MRRRVGREGGSKSGSFISARGGGNDRGRERTKEASLWREIRCAALWDFARFIVYPRNLNIDSHRSSFLLWAQPFICKHRHEVGRRANNGGQSKQQPFSPRRTHYSSLRLQWPPLPAKFFSLFAVAAGSLSSSLTSCPIPSKFIYLPSELCFFFFPRKCVGRLPPCL